MSELPAQFKRGDIVKHVLGGPTMHVDGVHEHRLPEGVWVYQVCWFTTDNEYQTFRFGEDEIIKQ